MPKCDVSTLQADGSLRLLRLSVSNGRRLPRRLSALRPTDIIVIVDKRGLQGDPLLVDKVGGV